MHSGVGGPPPPPGDPLTQAQVLGQKSKKNGHFGRFGQFFRNFRFFGIFGRFQIWRIFKNFAPLARKFLTSPLRAEKEPPAILAVCMHDSNGQKTFKRWRLLIYILYECEYFLQDFLVVDYKLEFIIARNFELHVLWHGDFCVRESEVLSSRTDVLSFAPQSTLAGEKLGEGLRNSFESSVRP